jgi:hypothetical protein
VPAALAAGCGSSATHQTIVGNRIPVPLGGYAVDRTGPHELVVKAVAPKEDTGFAVAVDPGAGGRPTAVHVYVLREPEDANRPAGKGAIVCLKVETPAAVPGGPIRATPKQPDPFAGLTPKQRRALREADHDLDCRTREARVLDEVPRAR